MLIIKICSEILKSIYFNVLYPENSEFNWLVQQIKFQVLNKHPMQWILHIKTSSHIEKHHFVLVDDWTTSRLSWRLIVSKFTITWWLLNHPCHLLWYSKNICKGINIIRLLFFSFYAEPYATCLGEVRWYFNTTDPPGKGNFNTLDPLEKGALQNGWSSRAWCGSTLIKLAGVDFFLIFYYYNIIGTAQHVA